MTTMSQARAKVLGESAKELTPEKNLDRANEHTKFIIATVGTIGTLLAGAGGVTAAIAIDRTTLYLGGIPVVPVGALVTSALAGLSVGVALWGRRPNFAEVNPLILEDVESWFAAEIDRKKKPVTWSARFFIWAAFAAVLTSVIAGVLVLADPVSTPRNLASFSTTVADKGVVTLHLGGAVDGLDEHAHMSVVVTTNAPGQTTGSEDRLVDVDVRPDADGKVTLDAEATAPVGSSAAVATVRAGDGDGTPEGDKTWTLTVSYPTVPAPPDPNASATAIMATATPAVVSLVANYLSAHGGTVPASIADALKGIDLAAWVQSQQELKAHGQLTPQQTDRLDIIAKWLDANKHAATFNRNAGAVFVWAGAHGGNMPGPDVHVNGRALGKWVAKQQRLYAAEALTLKQVALLEAIPGWTWTT